MFSFGSMFQRLVRTFHHLARSYHHLCHVNTEEGAVPSVASSLTRDLVECKERREPWEGMRDNLRVAYWPVNKLYLFFFFGKSITLMSYRSNTE